MSQDSATRFTIPTPPPDNVEALADAVNRFHSTLNRALQEDQAITRIFASAVIGSATIVTHYTKEGDA